ncbi:DUF4214 domain-containing protein [Herbaspirillum sp. HC18]|nr:DUF4214 domain-containing protein [Herbaspirillum sp. HC18]
MKLERLWKSLLPALAVSFAAAGCGGGSEDSKPVARPLYAGVTTVNGVATFAYNRNNYTITSAGLSYIVTPLRGTEGVTTLTNVQALKFADVTINLGIGSKSKTISSSDLTSLIELYIAYFNRVPDADGLSYWIDQLKAGSTLDQIGASFYAAAIPYSSLTGYSSTMTNADFVTKVYQNVLGRSTPDQEGLDYWSSSLANGTQTRGTLIRSMLYSAHSFKGNATYGWVADLLDNKASVSNYFAVQQGLNYNSPATSIEQGMAIAAAITSTSTAEATSRIGTGDAAFNLLPIATVSNSSNLTLSPSILTKSLNAGQSQSLTVRATANTNFPAPINVAIVDTKGVITTDVSLSAVSAYAYDATIRTSPTLAPGMYEGTIEVRICKDSPLTCQQPHAGSPWKLPYRFVVSSNLSANTDALSGSTNEGSTYTYPTRSYTLASGQIAPDYEISYAQGSGWLTVKGVNGQLQAVANAAGLKAGKYTATITLYGLGTAKSQIPVTLTVTPGFTAPSQLALQINSSTPNTDAGQTITGTFSAAASTAWTVKSNQPWLIVDTSSGSGTSNTLRAHVDPALAAAFANNSVQQAALTISAVDGSFSPVTIPVSVTIKFSTIAGSAPFHVFAGETETITLTGSNLDQLDLTSLTMGGRAVVNPKLINSSAVSFQPPVGLPTGLQPIAASGRVKQTISIPVITYSGTHNLQFLQNVSSNEPDLARRLVFDDGRNDLYASNHSGIAKYHYDSGAWTRSWLSIPDAVYAIALSPDRTTLVAAASSSLHLIDVQTFKVTASINYPNAPNGSRLTMQSRYASIAFAPGGTLLLPLVYAPAFDLQSKTFSSTVSGISLLGVMSLNQFGNQVFMNWDVGVSTTSHDWRQWKAGETGFSTVATRFDCNTATVSVSRHAELVSCRNNFYSSSGGLLGTQSTDYYEGDGYTLVAPDGSAAYSIRNYGFINAYQFANGFRKTGKFTDNARLYNAAYWDYDLYGILNDALISQDGTTLFVALPTGIYVIPVSAFTPVN